MTFLATGIGFAIAESFAKAGVDRLVLIQRRHQMLEKAKQTIESKYPNTKVTTYATSVNDLERISSIIKEIGRIDILVCNAAISHPFVPSKDVTIADFKATFDTNVVSTFHIIKEFLALESSGPRVVIYTSSAAAQIARPGSIGYGPSKAAANQIIQHFAMENADTNVTVQAFHPGAIYTQSRAELELTAEDSVAWEDGKLGSLLKRNTGVPKWLTINTVSLPGDFAVWLASAEAKYLAGRFVWAQWDVDELLALKGRLAANPALLTTTIAL